MKNTLLSIGHGYTAQAFVRSLPTEKWHIVGTSRNRQILEARGIEPMVWPGSDLSLILKSATHLLTSVSPDNSGDAVLNALSDDIAAAPNLKWIGYLSTTAVYGDHKGGWVDETTPVAPTTKRGQWRAEAEKAWLDFSMKQSLPVHIFRLAGIYGPGRGPFTKVRVGTARRIVKPDQVFSRIHVDDIAQTLTASMNRPNPGTIYNVCDDLAAPPEDVIEYAAKLLKRPVPPAENWETAELTPMARSFYGDSKRVRNSRIKTELGVKLRYPDYVTGLNALLAAEMAR